MYNGIGGPGRGSGSSGYVQSNRAGAVQPGVYELRTTAQPKSTTASASTPQTQPDQSILDHQRARKIEVALCDFQDRLEDEGRPHDEISTLLKAERARLEQDQQPTGRQSRVEYHEKRSTAHELDY